MIIRHVYGIDKRQIHFTFLLHAGRCHEYLNLIMKKITNTKIGNVLEGGREIT
jgi:hypothetical protein